MRLSTLILVSFTLVACGDDADGQTGSASPGDGAPSAGAAGSLQSGGAGQGGKVGQAGQAGQASAGAPQGAAGAAGGVGGSAGNGGIAGEAGAAGEGGAGGDGAAGGAGEGGVSGGAGEGGAGGAGEGGAGEGGAATGGAGQGGGAGQVEPLLRLIDISNPADLTPDGRLALLQDFESATGDIYLYDVDTEALDKVGDASNPDPANGDTSKGTPLPPQAATRLSADASRIVGTHGLPLQAALFEMGSWADLGGLDGNPVCPGDPTNLCDGGAQSAGWDISADGKTVVGMAWNGCSAAEAVRWVEGPTKGSGAFVALEFAGKSFNRATRVSADGQVVGGWVDSASVDRSPALWDANGKITLLDPGGEAIGEVLALGADGKSAAGPFNDASGNGAFLWTEAGGMKLLPKLATAMPTDQVFANAVAAGGKLVFGAAGDLNGAGSPLQAFVYTAHDDQMRPLQQIAEAQGLSLPPNVTLANVLDASDDGTIVLGTTLDNDPTLPFPKQRSFWLRLPLSAYGL